MTFRKNLYAISISAVILAMTGCGITPQDDGLGNSSSKPMSGVVVDGYLAGAIVYVDVNENNMLDAWEKRALTDTKGYFTFNPITDVNYCELPETDSKFIHCLKAPSGYSEVMLRMTKGYDLATVEPFTGTISIRANVSSADVNIPIVATPVSGLLSEMNTAEQTQFLSDEGITDVAATDFLDYTNTLIADDRRKLLNIALKAHKVADVVADLLDPYYDQTQSTATGFFGVEENIPTDGSLYVYRAIVSQVSATNTLSSILTDATKMDAVINQAIVNMNGVIEDYNARLPHDINTDTLVSPTDAFVIPTTLDSAAITAIRDKVLNISNTVEVVFGATVTLDSAALSDDVISRIRAIDAVVSLTRNGDSAAAISKAVSLASDAAYLTNLRNPAVDMASLKKRIATATDPSLLDATVANFAGRQSFSQLLGSSSGLTGTNTEGFGGNALDLDSGGDAVNIDFGGGGADTSGSLSIDATFLTGDYAKTDATGAQEPLALEGTWEKIDDYSMLMNIEVTAGVYEPVIVKPNEDGTGYYFDLGGEQVVWAPGAATP